MTMTERAVAYKMGLVYLSACAPKELTAEEVEAQMNEDNPTGVTPWKVGDARFRTGEPNPCACEHDPGKQHWLLSC